MGSLEKALDALTRPAPDALSEDLGGGRVRCRACGHRCRIAAGKRGICKVRFNREGTLMVPAGYVAGLAVDPIEKKPFYHVLPGASALSFGMLGCDFQCDYCQNWLSSQALRDDAAGAPVRAATAEEIVALALTHAAPVVTSTYNEPLITVEWAVEVFDRAKAAGLLTSFVSNGHATPEVLSFLAPRLDFMKIDLKGFRKARYRELGGGLSHVLATIEGVLEKGIWLEVVTLVVPGFNDSDEELREIAGYLADLSPGIPWHVSAFHPDYRMQDRGGTKTEALLRALNIGREAGLHFVYPGNVHGRVGERENTICPGCASVLIPRTGYRIGESRIRPDGKCPDCDTVVPGYWSREHGLCSSLPSVEKEGILNSMAESDRRKKQRDGEYSPPFFSCAFCHTEAPKPFKICESCGEHQVKPEGSEE